MRSAVIYCRFSPRPEALSQHEPVSNVYQESMCRKYCELRGYPVAGVFRDEYASGADETRAGLQEAMKAVVECRGVLVVLALSRLARSVPHLLQVVDRLERGKADLALVEMQVDTSTPQGRLILTILGAVAELERSEIAVRTSRGMKARQARGERMSRWAPFGWRIEGDRLVEYPEQQGVIRDIWAMIDDGASVRGVAKAVGLHLRTVQRIVERGRAEKAKENETSKSEEKGNSDGPER